jgi:hypothetical protein
MACFAYDVFLSYSRADKAIVTEIARRLEDEAGVTPFLDQWHLVPGEPWQEALEQALGRSATCAIFLGASGLGPWQNAEMRAALDARIKNGSLRVIPVLLPNAADARTKPVPFLELFSWVDFEHGADDPESFNRLVAGIRGTAPGRGTGGVGARLPAARPELSDVAKASRKAYADLCREYQTRRAEEFDTPLAESVARGSVLDPAITPLPPAFADYICTAVCRAGRTILILPSGDSTQDVEGVGRTSILLRLLGVRVPYGRLLGRIDTSPGELPKTIEVFGPDDKNQLWCSVVATDMAYLGAAGNQLCVIPTRGEPLNFVWDLARHIFRSTSLVYYSGDHRESERRHLLLEMFNRIPLGAFQPLFAELEARYLVDEVFILRRDVPNSGRPKRRDIAVRDKLELLRKGLLVSARHQSRFWSRDQQMLSKIIDFCLAQIDCQTLPVTEVAISHTDERIPKYVFDEAADLIRMRTISDSQRRPIETKAGVGVRYHNQEVLKDVRNVNELRILATSGEHLFKDVAFWKVLASLTRPFQVKILLLNPKSPAVGRRQESAYREKPSGFLEREIHENIETILRMDRYFAAMGGLVRLRCGLYRDIPPFRMTIMGDARALVASYESNKSTGADTVFFDLRDDEPGMFHGFLRLYTMFEASAVPVDDLGGFAAVASSG